VLGAPDGHDASSLRARQTQLEERAHAALLDLYSIDTQLARARARVSALDRKAARFEREGAAIRESLTVARAAIVATQRQLGDQARSIYESGDQNDPIAILLGAESLGDALSRLDNIEQIAAQRHAVLKQATQARTRLLALRADLGRRESALDQLRTDARASAVSLEAARSSKAETIHQFSSERALTARKIASLARQATAAASKSISTEQSTPPTSTAEEPPPPVSGGSIKPGATMSVSSTCYCLTGGTASGLPVGPGIAATDPTVIPMGTRFYVPGYGNAVAADTGSAVKGADIDLWVADCNKASAWGRRQVTITFR
jgi:3D (Asp-Asp-Asp) domain-containing protein/peptidoglycan hydrolase CwlO-like protein